MLQHSNVNNRNFLNFTARSPSPPRIKPHFTATPDSILANPPGVLKVNNCFYSIILHKILKVSIAVVCPLSIFLADLRQSLRKHLPWSVNKEQATQQAICPPPKNMVQYLK
jgi:hypothetical protein